MTKRIKTRGELEVMVMTEVRRYPECEKVEAVAVTRPLGRPWDIAVVRDGPQISVPCHLRIHGIVQRLCAEYDLAPESN
jgi:hypothetical protein